MFVFSLLYKKGIPPFNRLILKRKCISKYCKNPPNSIKGGVVRINDDLKNGIVKIQIIKVEIESDI